MPKIYVQYAKQQQIVSDAAMREYVKSAAGREIDFGSEAEIETIDALSKKYAGEVAASDGQTIPAGAVPTAMTVSLSNGMVYFVAPHEFMIDTTQSGILK